MCCFSGPVIGVSKASILARVEAQETKCHPIFIISSKKGVPSSRQYVAITINPTNEDDFGFHVFSKSVDKSVRPETRCHPFSQQDIFSGGPILCSEV